jgi:predicted ester cyclase
MSTPCLVKQFYERLWNAGEVSIAPTILDEEFVFRGSLGSELRGIDAFIGYLNDIRSALDGYNCDIVDCVSEGQRAFARMRFSGLHVGAFRGYDPTNRIVSWAGAALFTFELQRIRSVWVLGDLAGLDAQMRAQASPEG